MPNFDSEGLEIVDYQEPKLDSEGMEIVSDRTIKRDKLAAEQAAIASEGEASYWRGFKENEKEAWSNLASGAGQVIPSTLRTIGSLSAGLNRNVLNLGGGTKPEEMATYQWGEAIQKQLDKLPTGDKSNPDFWLQDVPSGIGQMGSMLATGAGAKALGWGAKGAAAIASASGFGMEFDDAMQRSVDRGDDADKALLKSLGYASLATLVENRIGAGRLLRKYFPNPEEVVKALTKWGVGKEIIKNIAAGYGEEATQRILQNAIVEETVDPKKLVEGAGREGTVGAVVQGIAGLPAAGGGYRAGKRRLRIDEPTPLTPGTSAQMTPGMKVEIAPIEPPPVEPAAEQPAGEVQGPPDLRKFAITRKKLEQAAQRIRYGLGGVVINDGEGNPIDLTKLQRDAISRQAQNNPIPKADIENLLLQMGVVVDDGTAKQNEVKNEIKEENRVVPQPVQSPVPEAAGPALVKNVQGQGGDASAVAGQAQGVGQAPANLPVAPAALPPLPSKDVAIKVQRADGTAYDAGFNGWQPVYARDESGEPVIADYVPMLSKLKPGENLWSTGATLEAGEKIVGNVPAKPEILRKVVTPDGKKEGQGVQKVAPNVPVPVQPAAVEAAAGPSLKAAEDQLIEDGTQDILEALGIRPPKDGTSPRASGGPDTAKIIGGLAKVGEGYFRKGSRKFEPWKQDMVRHFGEAASRITQYLEETWKALTAKLAPEFPELKQKPQGFVKQSIADRKARKAAEAQPDNEVAIKAAKIQAAASAAGLREAAPELTPGSAPDYSVSKWLGVAAKKLGKVDDSWVLRAWKSLGISDIRKLTSDDILRWFKALESRYERHQEFGGGEKGRLEGEPSAEYSKISDGLYVFKNAVQMAMEANPGAMKNPFLVEGRQLGMGDMDIPKEKSRSKKYTMPSIERLNQFFKQLPDDFRDVARAMILFGPRPGELLRRWNSPKSDADFAGLRWDEIHLEADERFPEYADGYIDLTRKRTKVPVADFMNIVPLTKESNEFFRELKQRKNQPANSNAEIFGDVIKWKNDSTKFNSAVRSAALKAGFEIDPKSADMVDGQMLRKFFATLNVGHFGKETMARYMGHSVATLEASYLLSPGAQAMGQKAANAPRIFAQASPPELPTTTIYDPAMSPVVEVPVASIKLSKDVPQFKSNADERGIVAGSRLEGKYERLGTAPIVLWRRKNGDLEIITGRHRFDLARRSGELTIPSQIVDESKGFTTKQAMTFDALSNIRDGQGEIEDYADYFRDSINLTEGEARQAGLLARTKGRSGWDLGKHAGEDLYSSFKAGKISEAQALAIVRAAPDDNAGQRIGIRYALNGKDAQFISDLLKISKQEAGARGQDIDLFGNDDTAIKEMEARAKRAGQLRSEIEQNIKAISGAAKRPDLASKQGVDVSDPAAVVERLEKIRSELKRWENWPSHPDLVAAVKADIPAEPKKKADSQDDRPASRNLTPSEASRYRTLRNKERNETELTPKEKTELERLAGAGLVAELFPEEDIIKKVEPQPAAEAPKPPPSDQLDLFANRSTIHDGGLPAASESLSKAEVEALISKKDAAGFTVKVVSRDEAVAANDGIEDTRNFDGFYDPAAKTIFIVHENMVRGDTKRIGFVVREEAAHGLLRTDFGNRLMYQALGDLMDNLSESDRQFVESMREQGYKEWQLIEEFVAKSAAEQQPWWKRVAEKIRSWLAKYGWVNLSNAEISRIIVKGLQRLNQDGELTAGSQVAGYNPASRATFRQLFGRKNLGVQYQQENIAETQERIRANPDFNFTGAVNMETTERAARLLARLADPQQAGEQLQSLTEIAPEKIAGSLLLSDVWDYAVRSIRDANDQSLFRFMIQQDSNIASRFGLVSATDAASILRGRREGADSPLWQNAREVFKAIEDAAKTKLFGAELADEMIRIIREDLRAPDINKEQLRVIIEDKLTQAGETPEIKYALRLLDEFERTQTEWMKPEKAQLEIKKIVQEALRKSLSGKTIAEAVLSPEQQAEYLRLQQIENQTESDKARIVEIEAAIQQSNASPLAQEFRQKLSADLFAAAEASVERENEKIRALNEKIDEENETLAEAEEDGEEVRLKDRIPEIEIDEELLQAQMDRLAFEIWKEKLRLESVRSDRARAKEANYEEDKAKAFMDRWSREQVDWVKQERKSEVQKVITEFLKSGKMTEAELRTALIAAGVKETTAGELAYQAIGKKASFDASRKVQMLEREAKRIAGLANKTARQILEGMETSQTEWNPGDSLKNAVREIIRKALKIKPTQADIERLGEAGANQDIDPISDDFSGALVEKLKAAGVTDAGIAERLAQEVRTKRNAQWATARDRMLQRASKSNRISGLMDEILDAPYLLQQNPKWRQEVAVRWFMGNQLSREQAEEATKLFQKEFQAALDKAAVELGKRLTSRIKPGAESVEEFIEAFRAGLVDPSKPWAEEYAKKAGWNLPTPEQLKLLAELDLQLDDSEKPPNEKLTIIEKKEITERMMGIYLHMRLPSPLLKIIAANFIATNLTGLRTISVNMLGPGLNMVWDRFLQSMAAPHRLGEIWKPLIEAFRGYIQEFKYSLTTDAYTFINNEFEPASNELRRMFESGRDDLVSNDPARRGKGVLKVLFGSQQFFMRMLNAFDQASAVAMREAQLAMYGSSMFRELGMTTKDVNDLIQVMHDMKKAAYLNAYLPPSQLGKGYSKMRARVQSDAFSYEAIKGIMASMITKKLSAENKAENKNETEEQTAIEATTAVSQAADAAEKDAYSSIGRLAPNVQERDEGGILSHLGIHSILDYTSKMRRGHPQDKMLAVALFGYLSVPIRTARFYAWNSPYGLVRIAIHKYQKRKYGAEYDDHNWWKQSLGTEAQVRYRTRQALAATAVQALLTATGFAAFGLSGGADDEDLKNGIFVTGDGPKNKNLQDAWLKKGFRKNSVVMFINGKAASAPLTRLGEPLAHVFWILSARDDYNWRKKEKEATGKPFEETWTDTTGHTLGNYVSLLGQRGIIQNVTRWARAGGEGGGTKAALASVAGSSVASASMPFLGMQRSIRDIVMGRVDNSSIQAALMANFPVLGGFQERAVNRFGDPLGNQTWYGKIADTGVPIAFQVSDNPENRKLYEMLVTKGISAPVLRRAVLEEKYGVLSDPEYAKFVRQSGANLKKSVLASFNAISNAPAETGKKTLAKLAGSADKLAAQSLGMESQTPAKSRSSTGFSLGATPSDRSFGQSYRPTSVAMPRARKVSYVRGRLSGGRSRRLSLRPRRMRSFIRKPRRLTSRLRRPAIRRRRLSIA